MSKFCNPLKVYPTESPETKEGLIKSSDNTQEDAWTPSGKNQEKIWDLGHTGMTKIPDTLNFSRWRIASTAFLTGGKQSNPPVRESEQKSSLQKFQERKIRSKTYCKLQKQNKPSNPQWIH